MVIVNLLSITSPMCLKSKSNTTTTHCYCYHNTTTTTHTTTTTTTTSTTTTTTTTTTTITTTIYYYHFHHHHYSTIVSTTTNTAATATCPRAAAISLRSNVVWDTVLLRALLVLGSVLYLLTVVQSRHELVHNFLQRRIRSVKDERWPSLGPAKRDWHAAICPRRKFI